MTYSSKERKEYNIYRDRVCERLGITVNQFNWLRRKGEELRKVYENNCNGLYKTEEESNLAEEKIKTQIYQYRIVTRDINRLYWYLQTDPRGATIYCDTKPIPDDNYTQAYCIY